MHEKKSIATLIAIATVPLLMLLSAPLSLGATYKVLYSFSGGTDGSILYGGVVLDRQGNLFGPTAGGGQDLAGTIYKLTHEPGGIWTKTIIHDLNYQTEGGHPNGGMVFDQAGNLYGTTWSGGPQLVGTIFQLVPNPDGPWTLNLLYEGGSQSGLAIDPAGNLFGFGGPGQYHEGDIFRLSPNPGGWEYSEIYSFGLNQDDGGTFYAPLILDQAGNLYGTSFGGGHGRFCGGGGGCGTAYKLHPTPDGTWTEHIFHRFGSTPQDGRYLYGSLVRDVAGNLYGTTLQGGNDGTIFKLSRKPSGGWKETILYNFPNAVKNGGAPAAGMVFDQAGNLYGTASSGGDAKCQCGVVYKLDHNPDETWTYSVLHRFHGTDGWSPQAPLVMDKKGHLYGTTVSGGPGGYGVVFKITP